MLLAAFIYRQTGLPLGLRLALAVLALLAAVASAMVQIDGRPLEDWLLLAGRYCARPRVLVWRPRRPDHPWAHAAAIPRTADRGDGARYCLRQIRVRWGEPAHGAGGHHDARPPPPGPVRVRPTAGLRAGDHPGPALDS